MEQNSGGGDNSMKLLSTLRYGPFNGMAAGTGNYGGDLHLFFTTLNPADAVLQPGTPPSVLWQAGAGKGAQDTYNLPDGDVIAMNLNLVAGMPNQLYIMGAIQVTSSGVTYGPPVGQAAGAFAPGKPVVAILKGRTQGQSGGKTFDVGFEVAVPWDGILADCHGHWWAIWR